ncbi:hypothetical protein [Deinococcus ficus]|jgi:hypothetical protein|nr:hypothetical protein [Deinococcus ficus]
MNKNRFAAVLSVMLLSLSLPAAAQTQDPIDVLSTARAAGVQPIDVMRDPIDVLRDPIDVLRDPIDVLSVQP